MLHRTDSRQISMPLARSDDQRYQTAEALARDATWAAFVALQDDIPPSLLIEAAGDAVYGGLMSAHIGRRILLGLGAAEPEDRSHGWLAGKGLKLGQQGRRPEVLGETSVRSWACIHAHLDKWFGSTQGVDWGQLTREGRQHRLDAISKKRICKKNLENKYSTLI